MVINISLHEENLILSQKQAEQTLAQSNCTDYKLCEGSLSLHNFRAQHAMNIVRKEESPSIEQYQARLRWVYSRA